MRIESALNTGREGITAHGQAIAVVGDNISNANTVGFKNQRAIFGDMLGETPGDRVADVVSGAGDGVTIRSIQSNFEVGPIQGTGRELDVALSGNGFFQVGDIANPQLTRAGSFQLDQDGFLTTMDGLRVLGYTGGVIWKSKQLRQFLYSAGQSPLVSGDKHHRRVDHLGFGI